MIHKELVTMDRKVWSIIKAHLSLSILDSLRAEMVVLHQPTSLKPEARSRQLLLTLQEAYFKSSTQRINKIMTECMIRRVVDHIGPKPAFNHTHQYQHSAFAAGPFSTGQKRGYSTKLNLRPSLLAPSSSQTRAMSARPTPPVSPKTTIASLLSLVKSKRPIAVLTAYDYPTALLSERGGVDMTLVGDSLSQVALGHDSTTAITLDEMIHHARAVVRGAKTPFVFADMPFGSFESSLEEGIRNTLRMIKEAGVDGVKIEGGMEIVPLVQRLSSIGIPVMPHIGLQPQRATSLSGFLVQGRSASSAYGTLQTARALADAGAFAILLEAVPGKVARVITEDLEKRGIFTIGIGAGQGTSGQVLVITDVIGTYAISDTPQKSESRNCPLPPTSIDDTIPTNTPRFVRPFGNVGVQMAEAVRAYVGAVQTRGFPNEQETYKIQKSEWEAFEKLLELEKGSAQQ